MPSFKVTVVGDLSPIQCQQLTFELLELLYQGHRQAERDGMTPPDKASAESLLDPHLL